MRGPTVTFSTPRILRRPSSSDWTHVTQSMLLISILTCRNSAGSGRAASERRRGASRIIQFIAGRGRIPGGWVYVASLIATLRDGCWAWSTPGDRKSAWRLRNFGAHRWRLLVSQRVKHGKAGEQHQQPPCRRATRILARNVLYSGGQFRGAIAYGLARIASTALQSSSISESDGNRTTERPGPSGRQRAAKRLPEWPLKTVIRGTPQAAATCWPAES